MFRRYALVLASKHLYTAQTHLNASIKSTDMRVKQNLMVDQFLLDQASGESLDIQM